MFLFVFLIFAFAQRRRAAPEYLGWEWGGGSVADQGPPSASVIYPLSLSSSLR